MARSRPASARRSDLLTASARPRSRLLGSSRYPRRSADYLAVDQAALHRRCPPLRALARSSATKLRDEQSPVPAIHRPLSHFINAVTCRLILFVLGFLWITSEEARPKARTKPAK